VSDRGVEVMFYALLLVLPVAALIARKPPLRRVALLAGMWVAIFVLALLVLAQF
jgi:aspartyl protease family protein